MPSWDRPLAMGFILVLRFAPRPSCCTKGRPGSGQGHSQQSWRSPRYQLPSMLGPRSNSLVWEGCINIIRQASDITGGRAEYPAACAFFGRKTGGSAETTLTRLLEERMPDLSMSGMCRLG
ncbi:hypothetical protein V8F20_004821 [Naviculisporaceae sp. PSN 640]